MPRTAALGIIAAAAALVGCSGESFVEGALALGEIDPANSGYEFAEVRAFPEHADGFSIERIYVGTELLEQSFLLGEPEVPINFRLEGYDIGDPGGPWRILAWLTNREGSEWVATQEPYGTRSFTFDCANGPVCAIRGVDLEIDQVAAP